jgi:hypothetical protein
VKVGLIDVDAEHFGKNKFPNLALMKLSAWHKAQGDDVEWWFGFHQYDVVYMAKVFDETYTDDIPEPVNAAKILKGGTGYGLHNKLSDEVEHIYPDYSIYPSLTKDTAYGFLTRGCPRGCHFCIVAEKEGRRSVKVADLSEWWSGQKNIVLMDANLLACTEHMELLGQLAYSGAYVDINQGLDAKRLTKENIDAINQIKIKNIHFAWDLMVNSKKILQGLDLYKSMAVRKPHGAYATVYVLTNFNTTMEENLYRIEKLQEMGFDPFVMIYDKPHAPKEIRYLQRWCNTPKIRKTQPDFYQYDPRQA